MIAFSAFLFAVSNGTLSLTILIDILDKLWGIEFGLIAGGPGPHRSLIKSLSAKPFTIL
jgi:hypothetical protein